MSRKSLRSEWASPQPRSEQPGQGVASLHSPAASSPWPSQQGVSGSSDKGWGFAGGEALPRREEVGSDSGARRLGSESARSDVLPPLVRAQQAPWSPTSGYRWAVVDVSVETSVVIFSKARWKSVYTCPGCQGNRAESWRLDHGLPSQ